MGFDTALLATGANVRAAARGRRGARRDPLPAALGNSDAIREDAERAEHVVLIGGSYIGCEVAASLTASHGRQVLDRDAWRTSRSERHFGAEVGALLPGRARGARRGDPRRRRARRASRATAGGCGGGDRGGPRARLRLRGDRRRRDARRDARRARPASSWARPGACAARRGSRPRCRASTPPATSASTTARCTAAGCGWSTGTWPPTRARRRR